MNVAVKEYDPFQFWERHNHMRNTLQHQVETDRMLEMYDRFVVPSCLQVPKVLEVGPGWGRVLKAFQKSDRDVCMQMADIVDLPRKRCKEETGALPDRWDGKVLPYPDATFDLVILFDVLLHVTPSRLPGFWREQLRVSHSFVYVATGVKLPRGQPIVHSGVVWCFNHDYKKLFDGSVGVVMERLYRKRRSLGERWNWLLRKCDE